MLLPGIGRYTAGAIASFAFGLQVPVVDTNISRIFRRLFPPGSKIAARHADNQWAMAEELLPRGKAGRWNEALMDLGATVCTALSPRCERCPLQEFCPSAHRVLRTRRRIAKAEPGRSGIPNRIYRGRIVEALRTLKHGQSISSGVLARKAKHDFRDGDREWFNSLLESLERDGLIRRRGRSRISLPI